MMRSNLSLRPLVLGLASAPAVRALLVSSVLWFALFIYSHWALWRDPHGAYFHSDNIYDLNYSLVRQAAGRELIRRYNSTNPNANPDENNATHNATHASPNPALCAAVATVARGSSPPASNYFSDTVGSMLAGLSPQERSSFNLTILFANTDPHTHKEYNTPWVSSLADRASSYEGISPAERAELQRLEEASDFQRKGVLDYIYLLHQCYTETRAPFIAVFEGDIIFAQDWLARTLVGLQTLALPREQNVIQAAPEDTPPWLYLRLFYTETFLMWQGEDDWLYGNMFVSFGLVIITTGTVLTLVRFLRGGGANASPGYSTTKAKRRLGLGLKLDIPTIAVLSLIVSPAFLGLFFMAGKYNLPMYTLRSSTTSAPTKLSEAGVFPMDKHGCCTQGLVFDRAQVPNLIKRLQTVGRGQTDLMIEDYCNESGLRRFALGDQAIQHVGTVSSRGMASVHAQSVYAFYFEEKKEDVVRQKQKDALKGVDWALFRALEAPEERYDKDFGEMKTGSKGKDNSKGLTAAGGGGFKEGLGILPPL